TTLISIPGLKSLPAPSSFLYFWLRPYSFSRPVIKEVMDSLDRQAGLVFYSPTHRIIKDRAHLILSHKEDKNTEELLYPISERPEEYILPGICLKTDVFEKTSNTIPKDPHIAFMDFNKITFPIVLRKWKAGDKFIPLGMKTHKKISDFLTDLKLPLSKKEEVMVLCCNETIIWVVNYRIHNDFKVTEKTSKIFEIKTWHTF
ncbi:MAG: tRNA lysidine(34) synthetase TilS, partial [Bacteroidales bacterium]|nr:tRNA lysidine(34) synthetase TilS [Bacteroidales bacterium]